MSRRREERREVRVFPQNNENEKGVLAAIISDRMVAVEALPLLTSEDFGDKRHIAIFEAIKILSERGSGIDTVTIVDILNKNGTLESVGGMAYITEMIDGLPSTAFYKQYIQAMKRDKMLRRLLSIAKKIEEDAYTCLDEKVAIAQAESYILEISKSMDISSIRHITKAVFEVISELNDMARNPSRIRGLSTGFSNLDTLTNGLQRSDLIILAARPAIGKTAFALNIAANIVKKDKKKNVLVFSMEMPDVQLARRILCNISGIKMENVMSGAVDDAELQNLWEAGFSLDSKESDSISGKTGLYVDPTPLQKPSEIIAKVRRFMIEKKTLDLIIIDYLTLIKPERPLDSRVNEVSEISRSMKLLAKQFNVPVILIAQLSRSVEIRKERPNLSDIRESGAIEQDADIVMFLHKEKNQDPSNTLVELIVAKHRNGQCDTLAFEWHGETVSFQAADKSRLDALATMQEQQIQQGQNKLSIKNGNGASE